MKPFNFMRALAGDKMITRGGDKVIKFSYGGWTVADRYIRPCHGTIERREPKVSVSILRYDLKGKTNAPEQHADDLFMVE